MFSESEEDQDPMKTTLSNCGVLFVYCFYFSKSFGSIQARPIISRDP